MVVLRCPRCGAIVSAAAGEDVICPNCGFRAPAPGARAAPAPAPPPFVPSAPWPPPVSQPMAMPPMGAPPVAVPPAARRGKMRSPGIVVLLSIVTFGLYLLYWYWASSEELDGFTLKPRRGHHKIRIAILSLLAGLVVLLVGVVVILREVGSVGDVSQLSPAAAAPAILLILVGIVMVLVGMVYLYVGLWQMWKDIQEDDLRRLVPQPFNPAVMLLLIALGIVVPYVGIVFTLAAIVLTQKGLNRVWVAYPQVPGR